MWQFFSKTFIHQYKINFVACEQLAVSSVTYTYIYIGIKCLVLVAQMVVHMARGWGSNAPEVEIILPRNIFIALFLKDTHVSVKS